MKRLLAFTVNGDPFEVAVRPEATLLEVLREDLGFTGTKSGCGAGDCGACTVLLDGQPVHACLVLAPEAEGLAVETIEGLAGGATLHPLQRSFIDRGAIQCGFCTSGALMSAKALIDRTPAPTREQAIEALAGNLCRCTGYRKILDAVVDWQKPVPPDADGERAVVGRRVPKIDATDLATGRAVFTDDIHLPGMLYGKILTSPHAHARIRSIDTTKAEALPGVKAVLTAKDVPETYYGVSPARYDEHVLATDKVRYVGDEVAAVAAVDEPTCRRALDLIEVDYEVLPAVFDPFEAMEDGAPRIHDHPRYENNVNTRVKWHFGDVEEGFAEADVIREETFVGNRTYQSPIEPHCAVARWEAEGRVTLWTSTQVVHYVQHQLGRLLEIPEGDIRVVMTHCGGGFGGKAEVNPLEICSVLLSKKTGRPVKMRYTRAEMMVHCRGRHKQYVTMKIGAKQDGTITAVEEKAVLEGGAYSSFGIVAVYYAGAMVPTLYRLPHFKYDGYRTYTNLPACGAMRGHGCPHPRFAFEGVLDLLAEDLGIDPIDLRLKNAMQPNSETVNGLVVGSCEFEACLRTVKERSGWEQKRGKLPPGRGIGIGAGGFVSGAGYPIYRSKFPHSNAVIRVAEDGAAATLFIGEADIGQGSSTVLAQVAAEAMGIEYEAMRIVTSDTQRTPLGLGTYSSRVTLMGGNACRMAGGEVKSQVLEAAASVLEAPVEALDASGGRVFVKADPERSMPWAEAAKLRFGGHGPVVGRGHYTPPKDLGGKHKGATVGTSPAYSFCACVAEVEVDLETGAVKVLKLTDAHDVGRPINPTACEGQSEGAGVMMLSEALLEDLVFDAEGRMLNPSLHDYLIATTCDMPEIDTTIVPSFEPRGPYGAKEVGEGSTLPVIGAIANAVSEAIGARVKELPITPERIRALLRKPGG
ncbi:MAG: molybdopterin cofactor-binding domain-containing protein [Planctomycetota bacterium]|jgi:4-hydroxybenzoyl-CoA reductase subunit alpha